jgi:hypothetical protein
MRARFSFVFTTVGFLALASCGPQVGSGVGGDTDPDASASAPDAHTGGGSGSGDDGGSDAPDAGGTDAAPGAPDAQPEDPDAGIIPPSGCEESIHCPGDRICDPETKTCSDSIGCESHADCGDGAHCGGDEVCRKSRTGSPCDGASDCQAGDTCFAGFCGCEGTAFEAEPVPINMLMVLDRSNSMQCHVDGTDTSVGFEHPDSRWQAALGAIDVLVGTYAQAINFGLVVYPGSDALPGAGNPATALCDPQGTPGCDGAGICATGNRVVEVQSGGGALVLAALSDPVNAPSGCTPSGPSLQAQVGYDRLSDSGAENYILYITDGAENCSSTPNQVQAIQNLRNQSPEVRTFVVGFTEDVNPEELNEAAEAGGMARDGPLKYYQANDEAALTEALEEIGGLVLSCAFTLDAVPEDLDDLFVFIDNESIIRDPARQNGWDYEPATNTISLFGSICDELQAGQAEDVNIVHGCPIDLSSY